MLLIKVRNIVVSIVTQDEMAMACSTNGGEEECI
jgi:hypothetical protein